MTTERITELLNQWSATSGDEGGEAFALVYDELRRIAASYFRRERADLPLQATSLVHEAFLRLSAKKGFQWRSRDHFFAFSSRIMRRVLVDEARRRRRSKRGGGSVHLTLAEAGEVADAASQGPDLDLLLVDDALSELAEIDPQKAIVVELRFFAGLTLEETASALEISLSSVNRRWRLAKLWLYERLGPD